MNKMIIYYFIGLLVSFLCLFVDKLFGYFSLFLMNTGYIFYLLYLVRSKARNSELENRVIGLDKELKAVRDRLTEIENWNNG